jgi:hypothetical protein
VDILPSALENCIVSFRPLLRVEVYQTFYYLMVGLLVGEAKFGAVRSSVFAPADYQPSRISDFFTTHRVSPQAMMAELTALSLRLIYGGKLPERLFWLADSTQTEKPHAEKVSGLGLFHRSKRVIGRASYLQGHCYVCAAHLYQYLDADGRLRSTSLLCGALLYIKGVSIPALVGRLARHLRLPEAIRHVWVVDRGIISRTLLKALLPLGHFVLGRLRSNQIVYFAPRRQPSRGRKKIYGRKCRVDLLLRNFPDRLPSHGVNLRVQGKERAVKIYDAEILLRGVKAGHPCPARILIVVVPDLPKLKPWYLLTTDLDLDPLAAVQAYAGRLHIEVNFDEAKELGLGHYQGRSGAGVRRWAVLICIAQALLKLAASGFIRLDLPRLHWSWYRREDTVGQIRRRLIEFCRPHISRATAFQLFLQKLRVAA